MARLSRFAVVSVSLTLVSLPKMGVYPWNNMGNLLQRVRVRSMDAIVHMGDHACAHQPLACCTVCITPSPPA